MCAVVLWTTFVVDYIFLSSGLYRQMRVTLNVGANKLLCEIVSRFGFANACEYCIFSSSNVPNLSNTVPNSLGISNKVCC